MIKHLKAQVIILIVAFKLSLFLYFKVSKLKRKIEIKCFYQKDCFQVYGLIWKILNILKSYKYCWNSGKGPIWKVLGQYVVWDVILDRFGAKI